MNWSLTLSFIKGLMFGLEYCDDVEEGFFYICLDLGVIRLLYARDYNE